MAARGRQALRTGSPGGAPPPDRQAPGARPITRLLAALAGAACALAGLAQTARADAGDCTRDLGDAPTAEVLYNAGVCLEQERAIGAALRLYGALLQRYPSSPLVPRAMVRSAWLYESIAQFDRAARLYEDYARKYAGEKDAPAALRSAIALYSGIGDVREALAATERFAMTYGRKRSGETAELVFAASAMHREAGDDALIAHLERYLSRFGARGGRDRAAIAHATIGTISWKRSCPLGERGLYGLCRRAERRRRRAPPSCDPSASAGVRIKRDAALVKKARRHLEAAIKIYRPPPRPTSAREAAALAWRNRAELALIDAELEDYIDDQFPRGLDFDPAKRTLQQRSIERFRDWLKRMSDRGSALRTRYVALARGPDGAAAAFRAALLASHLRDQLRGSEIPKNIRGGPYADELKKAYCEALDDHAKPLGANAIAALEYCVALPGWSDWSRRCVAELERLAPRDHPPARERHGAAIHTGPILDTAGAVGRPSTADGRP